MDAIDIKILNMLSQNSRCSSSVIADDVNLSVSAVSERIRKMENNGIIKKYTCVLDYSKVGKDVMALIFVSIEHPRHNKNFENIIKKIKSVVECDYIAGEFDYVLKVIVNNSKSLERLLFEIKSIIGVSKTKTDVILSSIKEEHAVHICGKK